MWRTRLGVVGAFVLVVSTSAGANVGRPAAVAAHVGRPFRVGDQTAQAPSPVVAGLLGSWSGTGTVTGRESTLTMTWERAVGGAFVQLRFRNQMAATADQPAYVFEAHGYYRIGAGPAASQGTWVDSRGYIFPVVVTLTPDAFTSEWGSEATTERGRTVYRLVSPDVMEVVDSVRTADGSYREFGRSRLTRSR